MEDKDKNVDWYGILGVDMDATDVIIEKAARKMSRVYHPDKNTDRDAPEKFLMVTKAKELLLDSTRRREINAKLIAEKSRKDYEARKLNQSGKQKRDLRDNLEKSVSQYGRSGPTTSKQEQPPPVDQEAEKIKALRKENAAKMKAFSEEEKLREDSRAQELRKQQYRQEHRESSDMLGRQIKLKWKRSRFNHTEDTINKLLHEFGSIEKITCSRADGNKATITFSKPESAIAAVRAFELSKDYRAHSMDKAARKTRFAYGGASGSDDDSSDSSGGNWRSNRKEATSSSNSKTTDSGGIPAGGHASNTSFGMRSKSSRDGMNSTIPEAQQPPARAADTNNSGISGAQPSTHASFAMPGAGVRLSQNAQRDRGESEATKEAKRAMERAALIQAIYEEEYGKKSSGVNEPRKEPNSAFGESPRPKEFTTAAATGGRGGPGAGEQQNFPHAGTNGATPGTGMKWFGTAAGMGAGVPGIPGGWGVHPGNNGASVGPRPAFSSATSAQSEGQYYAAIAIDAPQFVAKEQRVLMRMVEMAGTKRRLREMHADMCVQAQVERLHWEQQQAVLLQQQQEQQRYEAALAQQYQQQVLLYEAIAEQHHDLQQAQADGSEWQHQTYEQNQQHFSQQEYHHHQQWAGTPVQQCNYSAQPGQYTDPTSSYLAHDTSIGSGLEGQGQQQAYSDFFNYVALYGEAAARRYFGDWAPPTHSSAQPHPHDSSVATPPYIQTTAIHYPSASSYPPPPQQWHLPPPPPLPDFAPLPSGQSTAPINRTFYDNDEDDVDMEL